MNASGYFSQSYAEARAKFLAAAEVAGLDPEAHPHPLLGRDGERLAIDVVRSGPAGAKRLLIISSACHGVEGFAGSGIQTGLLSDASWLAQVQASGVAILYIHALNPHGFSWWRRVTQEGVDLNRNWHDFHRPLPHNAGYDELAAALIPATWPPGPAAEAVLADYAARHGDKGLQAAITGGQYAHELGLFYGGRAPTWSQQTLRHIIQEQARHAESIAWIDLHTGLGPSGHGERIFAGPADPAALARARRWWGDQVTSMADGSSSSAPLVGLMWSVVPELLPAARYTGIALEFGTLPLAQMLAALRADHWLEAHPECPAEQARAIKQQIRAAFYVDRDDWKQLLLSQAREACEQALQGLASNDD
ncbi:M14 family metallopeptidase [Roseateles sp.]|uniref:M14 family metallopeptidase n=1 Tax=Roseateles sp. TaxID=1971397 RepID=UPI00286A0F84|nr:M14 family metallopeptidase [Roseateles sp.]